MGWQRREEKRVNVPLSLTPPCVCRYSCRTDLTTNVNTNTHLNLYVWHVQSPTASKHTCSTVLRTLTFMRPVHVTPGTPSLSPSSSSSLPPLSYRLLGLLQHGLSTSLLGMPQWYLNKNASSMDSRHTGTGVSTSASEPAGWWNHSSDLWNATFS